MRIIALLFSFFLVFVSCDIVDPQFTDAKFTVRNETNTDIALHFFNENINFPDRSIVLGSQEEYQGLNVESSVGNIFDDPERSVVGSLVADSIIVIFNNERFFSSYLITEEGNTFSYSEPINRNIFRSGNYEEIGDQEFLYTITQEDYNNATSCDGPCE